ncbi:hypothetical protein BCIN_06g05610 [Botrytis cinerea B05.10]|uniref:Uncharacterized protein n=1 Tax=Botryotinia fuckeliana (strain B05.10) TaxID=332648 RepID=A0A384JKL5_BOTFB|nr:hypothetical protein BCIN_06g05610 [Botrytis cinerea B05.10]ATZ51129.1 hypothetical protein BCIN_06g05610 [Botrytis cinerea B05.10]
MYLHAGLPVSKGLRRLISTPLILRGLFHTSIKRQQYCFSLRKPALRSSCITRPYLSIYHTIRLTNSQITLPRTLIRQVDWIYRQFLQF